MIVGSERRSVTDKYYRNARAHAVRLLARARFATLVGTF